ncbi:preprotein translocase subunit SecG [Galactobacter caseinivorans]|uniref:Protein-export membrane protein SecG n=1 Tax=Galactobacter caseinivorans TaxID=2676123 RepID=A0A496PKY8_9MICC|nr:preprotein translocase subunit SecG [Galactobacter caseinivorans]RKW71065.1 preprotein translocase subunit SecG [Galactobacter caseinivorans]
MNALTIALQVLVAVCSILLVMTVLFHKGRGGGISDMFGGGMASSLGSSGGAEKTLTRLTVGIALVWIAAIIGLALIMRFNVEA